ncbi:MAG: dTMP kinase [archaeon]|nr:dTMP kinase [archaeon]
METKKGLFITFEGIDGCGKSTQAKLLADYIFSLNKYNHVLRTREPYKNTEIRKILQSESDPYSQGVKLAEMFIRDRRIHVNELINPNLEEGIYVVSDRYSLSTLAYQQTQGVPLNELLGMHSGLPIPDLTFIVNIPTNMAIERMKKDSIRKEEQKFEKDAKFIEKLRKNYIQLANLPKHKIVIVDGRDNIEAIFEKQVKPAFDKVYNSHLSK